MFIASEAGQSMDRFVPSRVWQVQADPHQVEKTFLVLQGLLLLQSSPVGTDMGAQGQC